MTFICICSEEYLGYYNVLFESLKTFAADSKQILYFIGQNKPTKFDEVIDITEWYNNCNPEYNKLERICSLRAAVVLDAFDKGNQRVCFLGAKMQFFDYPGYIDNLLGHNEDGYQAFVTPHILEPLPDDGKFPSNASVSFTGHISTDFVAFLNTPAIKKFLLWQNKVMFTQVKTTSRTYLDQSWLNFLPFFVHKVFISLNGTENLAYWNFKQRELRLERKKWQTKDGPMVCFQFSGIDLDNPKSISTHQNRYEAEGDFLNFLTTYAKRVKEYVKD